jgi:hypothetical protein
MDLKNHKFENFSNAIYRQTASGNENKKKENQRSHINKARLAKNESIYLNKRQVMSSKRICTKCKYAILKNKSRIYTIIPKMYKSYSTAVDDGVSLKNPGTTTLFIKPFSKIYFESLNQKCPTGIKWNKAELCRKLVHLKNLNYILIKLFAGKEITKNNLKFMSSTEQMILKMIIKKKNYKEFNTFVLEETYFNDLSQSSKSKRFEENLRFITNKTFRFLQNTFKMNIFQNISKCLNPKIQVKSSNAVQTYAFFGYYFQKYCSSSKKQIETFFHPNCTRILDLNYRELIPKTVSQQYLKTLKNSSRFIRDFSFYLTKIIFNDAENDIVKKTRKLCQNWENILKEQGTAKMIEFIKKQLRTNPKFKLPWTIDEVKTAVNQMRSILNKD